MKVEEYYKKMVDTYAQQGFGSFPWEKLIEALDEDKHKGKYGEYWNQVPYEVLLYYKALGYFEAIKIACFLKEEKFPEITLQESEKLSQEIEEEMALVVRKVLNRFQEQHNNPQYNEIGYRNT